MENKTHYRKVFKSDHLGVADLEDLLEEGKRLVFTIKEVKQQTGVSVAGRKGNYNIAYFHEKIKPLVLNATNSKTLKSFCNNSPWVEDWKEVPVELFIDENVKMKGEIVGGVRIRSRQPVMDKPELTPKHPKWFAALKSIEDGKTTLEGIKKHYKISSENEKLMKNGTNV